MEIVGITAAAFIASFFALKLPINKYVNYMLLGIGICPMAYFCVVKYYYKDHEPNTAGAFIMFSAICGVILLKTLKDQFYKLEVWFDILAIAVVTLCACFVWFYGSRIAFLLLVLSVAIQWPLVIFKDFFCNKIVYSICVIGLILGSVAVRTLTGGNHDGLTYVYSKGGIVTFSVIALVLIYWLISLRNSFFENSISITCLSAVITCFMMLWFDSSFIKIPLILFIAILGYATRCVAFLDEGITDGTADVINDSRQTTDYNKREKISTALILALELSIALFVLGPLEIFTGNKSELYFGVKDFLPIMLMIAMIVGAIAFMLIMFLKGKGFKYVSYIMFAVEVCMYVQIMFMNIKLQEKNGSNMDWGQLRWFMPINLMIWIGICLIIYKLSTLKINKQIPIYGGIYLILVQVVAIISLLPSSIMESSKVNSVFSDENQYVLAKDENIVLFIVDALGRGDLDEYVEMYPDLLDNWNDFTEYTNANSDYSNTFPSIIHMITSYEYDESDRQWKQNAWASEKSKKFFDKVHSMGYQFNMYTSETVNIGGFDEVNGKIDNIRIENPIINKGMIGKLLLKASVYRSVPYIVKPKFEVFSYQYDEVADFTSPCAFMNYEFFEQLKERGLTVSDTMDKQVAVIHVSGYHYPYLNDENANYLENASKEQTARGAVHMLDEYLRCLDEIGKYDDTTIIITADHAMQPTEHPQPIFFIKEKGERHEDRVISTAPIRHRDLQATIVKIMDDSDNSFGTTIWDFKDGETRKRTLESNQAPFWKIEYSGDENEAFEEMRKNGIID